MTCNEGCGRARGHAGDCGPAAAGGDSRRDAPAAAESAWITTRSGRAIDLLHPDPARSAIAIDDIAWALCRLPRFNGHTSRVYTVGEHCLLGVRACTPKTRLAFLLHDASEAYLGDVLGPLKDTQAMAPYREIEGFWQWAIWLRFGLVDMAFDTQEVARVDKRMLVTEQRDLMGRMPLSTDKHKPLPFEIPQAAPSSDWLTAEFLRVFRRLVKATDGSRE